ncbi:MAG: polymer-forming cytoskeletal protein [Oligoflexia bacterium]|nr:polymer-forming cytoskeletal protein [Oligoflexia bacterium]
MSFSFVPGKEIESDLTLIGEGAYIKGDCEFDRYTRIHGRIEGKITGLSGSFIVVGENATVHGEIHGEDLVIDGFVHGNIYANKKVIVSETGRVLGSIKALQLEIKFGAYLEGKATTSHSHGTKLPSAQSH